MISRLWARTGLRARLGVLLFVTMAPLLVLSVGFTLMQRQQAIETARLRVRDLARLAADRVDDAVQDAGGLLQVLSRMPVLRQDPPDGCQALMRGIVDDHQRIAAIAIIGPEGRVICASPQPAPDAPAIDTPAIDASMAGRWFAAASGRDAPLSDGARGHAPPGFRPVIDMAGGRPALVVAGKLPAASDGDASRVLAISLNLEWLADAVGRAADPAAATALIIDPAHGSVLAHDPKTPSGTWAPASSSAARLLAALRAGRDRGGPQPHEQPGDVVEIAGRDGTVRLFGYARLADGETLTAIGLPRESLLQATNHRSLVALMLALGLCCLAAGLAWGLARVFVMMPFSRLASAAARLGRGELDGPVLLHPRDPPELHGFHAMLGTLACRLRMRGEEVATARAIIARHEESARSSTPCPPAGFPARLRAEFPPEFPDRLLMPPAHDDMLTGLPNRRGFDEALGLEYRCAARLGTPLALVMIEVDGFRAYIEAHGRPAGEACLRAIARVTDRQLRHSRDRAARYGTETFAAILPATDEGHAVIVAEAIRRSVEQEGLVHCGSPTTIATVSIGVAALVAGGDDGGPAGLVERADAALHEARRCGCNMVRAASLLAR